jgi:hypothetical protein
MKGLHAFIRKEFHINHHLQLIIHLGIIEVSQPKDLLSHLAVRVLYLLIKRVMPQVKEKIRFQARTLGQRFLAEERMIVIEEA